jgi:antitoxin (DNA-binding transcriptional repressor) of toxin-antitoxin stability system
MFLSRSENQDRFVLSSPWIQERSKDGAAGGQVGIPARSHFGYNQTQRDAMRQVSLREFRTRGVKALESVPQGETVLLSGQQGPAYFLVPVVGDVAAEDRELRRAMAKANLRAGWLQAEPALAEVSDEQLAAEIEKEIDHVRAGRLSRKAG